jgi:hypothetical protein
MQRSSEAGKLARSRYVGVAKCTYLLRVESGYTVGGGTPVRILRRPVTGQSWKPNGIKDYGRVLTLPALCWARCVHDLRDPAVPALSWPRDHHLGVHTAPSPHRGAPPVGAPVSTMPGHGATSCSKGGHLRDVPWQRESAGGSHGAAEPLRRSRRPLPCAPSRPWPTPLLRHPQMVSR